MNLKPQLSFQMCNLGQFFDITNTKYIFYLWIYFLFKGYFFQPLICNKNKGEPVGTFPSIIM